MSTPPIIGRTRDRNPVAALKERFHINQPNQPKANSCSRSHSRLRSKGPNNFQLSQRQQSSSDKSKVNNNNQRNLSKSGEICDHSVLFSSVLRASPLSSSHNQPSTLSPQKANDILSLLKALQ
ncbi:hypothetical protein RclHR1_20250007 [Rhizophagus clarus]|nr:hypothetical protein RclHR1_20250007 [Rhizophagus clarus]